MAGFRLPWHYLRIVMVFTECYSIFIQLIHIIDKIRSRAIRFDAVRYSSMEVQEKVKFSGKFVWQAIWGADKNGKAHSRSAATPCHKFESFAC